MVADPATIVSQAASDLATRLTRVVVEVDTSDCERVRDTVLAQPVNALSSLAYVAAGAWVLGRGGGTRRSQVFAALLAAAGLGSVAYHGTGGALSRWFHDTGFLWVLVFLAAHDRVPVGSWDRARRNGAMAGGVVVGLAVVLPAATDVAAGALAVVAAVVEARAWRSRAAAARRRLVAAGSVLALAGAVYLVSRTGAPLCDPESVVQGHGVWHLLTATAFALWAEAGLVSRRSVVRGNDRPPGKPLPPVR